MAYIKNVWVDQDVQRPKTYEFTNNPDGSVTLTDSFGVVTEIGTPVNALHMNHIEDGIEDHETRITTLEGREEVDAHALKGYEDAGELLTDSEGLADVIKYAHSTYDSTPFTPTGNPTNVDGVASGFTTSNYYSVSLSTTISTSDTFEYDVLFTTPASFGGTQTIWAIGNNYRVYQGGSGYLYCLFWGQSTGFQMAVSTTYLVKFIYDGSKIYAKYKKDTDTTWSTSNEAPISTGTTQNNPTITIGAQSGSNAFNGSIDLKYFAVKVNGSLVVSGNTTGTDTYIIGGNSVTIPYTLSKTGSKIAEASQRTNITALYNQEGYAPYYTLDEVNRNFTLPMGEIYGMHVDKSSLQEVQCVVETYVNGTSWYRVWSDGWCEQGGYSEENTTINFLKTFSDTNYCITGMAPQSAGNYVVCYDSKTASSIMLRIGSDTTGTSYITWQACGYIN